MIWKYCNIKRILFVVLNEAITGVAVATDNTFNLNPALNVRRTFCKASDRCSGKYSYIDRNCKGLALATFRKETP
jgi:hypothetical protein